MVKKQNDRGAKTKKAQNYNGADKDTRFQHGNQFWRVRSSHGRKPIFTDPEVLYEACLEYFDWCESNPMKEERVFCHQGEITRATINHPVITTIQGLCIFLDIGVSTWEDYRSKPDFSGTVEAIETKLWQNKLQYAGADLLNTNIVVREMGLKERSAKEITGKGGGPIETKMVDMPPDFKTIDEWVEWKNKTTKSPDDDIGA